MIEYDVIVIGAGVAGLTAGARLAGRGYKVAVVTTGEPTACLSTGCIDLCAGISARLGVEELPDNHPLRLVSMADMDAALTDFKTNMEGHALSYVGGIEENRRVLSSLGTFKTTCLTPVSMAGSPQDSDESIHIVTFEGLKDFYPAYILSRFPQSSFSVYDAGAKTTMGLASRFEQSAFLEAFITWLGQRRIRENKIGIPAVLGLEDCQAVIRQMEYHLERPVFEIPTLPPSMPGRRLFNALKAHFRAQGGDIYWSWPVAGVEKTGKLVEAVFTPTDGKPNSLNARAFILASGSFVGGGLTATRETIVENIFHLPVFVPSARAGWFEDDYFSANHAVSRAGVCVDSTFRPEGAMFENVFICGGILAHAQILTYGCGNGLSLTSGYAASQACAEYLA